MKLVTAITPERLATIPRLPGCYIFRNKHGQIIYIGKSKSLYYRVQQYFNLVPPENPKEYNKYAELAKEVADIETIVTDTETNALLLECKLIKTHKPNYNSQLKNGSDYHFICVDTAPAFPTITIVNEVKDDGRRYFGGFYDFYDAEKTVALLNTIWKTPVCNKTYAKPCLNFHIGKCCPPCGGMLPADEYRAAIVEMIKCLSGSGKGTLRRLIGERNMLAKALAFEQAAAVQEKIEGLENLMKKQKRLYTDLRGRDVFLFLRAFNEPCFSLFFIRDGVVIKRADFPNLDEPGEEAFAAFLKNENLPAKLQPADFLLTKNSLETLLPEESPLEYGKCLTDCVLAIYANKLFLPTSRNTSAVRRVRVLQLGFKAFLAM